MECTNDRLKKFCKKSNLTATHVGGGCWRVDCPRKLSNEEVKALKEDFRKCGYLVNDAHPLKKSDDTVFIIGLTLMVSKKRGNRKATCIDQCKQQLDEKKTETEIKEEKPMEELNKLVIEEYKSFTSLLNCINATFNADLKSAHEMLATLKNKFITGFIVECTKLAGEELRSGFFTIHTQNANFFIGDFVNGGLRISRYADTYKDEVLIEKDYMINVA